MANLKEVRTRISSVVSTQQITKAMKMVAAAKLRRAQDAILQMRPYAEKLNQILSNVSASLEGDAESKYAVKREEVKKALIITVTSDRGLCGAFNANIGKAALALIESRYPTLSKETDIDILALGSKGKDFLARREYNVNTDYMKVFTDLSFDKVKEAAEFAMDEFVKGTYDEVFVIYNEFKNVATQIIKTEQFLPIVEPEDEEAVVSSNQDYIFEPSVDFIIKELIPKSLKLQLYKAVLESNASEHGARMTAMGQATDNAGELLKDLRLMYNRTRQAQITTEILEIVGGAEALAQGG